ncbi:MAG TPA: WbuC family cupin fold metalloprotein [Steroidobacteraceae bacterium]|jgi:cupin fold WbuC family metalloprotein|nr:WbuC family cupin fold metalloprotein [Steroidobacteraceae bacterium]
MKILWRALLDELAGKAAASPRARAHYNIHADAADLVQRFVVVALPDSYFRPHRHAGKSELATVIRGHFDVLTFDERGRVLARYAVGADGDAIAYETPQGTWHTLVPGAAGGAFLEIKEGPYDPATAIEFAAWAPAEGAAHVPQFLQWLRAAQPGDTPPGAT